MSSTPVADLIEQAWNEHTADAAAVAAQLDAARPLLQTEPEQIVPFIQISEHVLLGHLGDVVAMERWCAQLTSIAAARPDAQPSLERLRLAMNLMRGGVAPTGLAPPLAVRAHGTAINGLAAQGDLAHARELLASASSLARNAGDADSIKALAATFNNLASQLLDGPRDDAADALMLEAARLSRSTWSEVGNWLNLERADYLLALCAAKVGDGPQAVSHARSCLALCDANDADAFERFFAHQALGEALRVRGDRGGVQEALGVMQALIGRIADEADRAYAQSALDKLQAAASRS